MEKIIRQPIETDMKDSYLDYAMSVIVGRALPDVRDGLKPVHRRVLYSMHELSNNHNKPYKKSARIVGDCLGKFHPHGDVAIYDSLVRMAQNFSLRYPLVDGHGNFGSIDGDSAASMRYTEVRMNQIAEEMLFDLEKETVDFSPNFDETLKEPIVLPSKIPNLLINGSSGIAVGMATNIPPYNLIEICDALIGMIDGLSEEQVISKILGPDFPTGGLIVGRNGILSAHKTGRGKIKLRSKSEIDEEKNHIIITQIPYQITKTSIIESIVLGVKEDRIDGIRGVHDHSDKEGIRLVIEVKRGEDPNVVLNQLYKHSPLETTFGIINLVLCGNEPKLLNTYSLLNEFLLFRKQIVTKRCQFDLKKAQERAHILEGLKIAIENIDEVVPLLKNSKNIDDAKIALMKKYSLSEVQCKSILEMKISRLVSLEHQKLIDEFNELLKTILNLKDILSNENKIFSIIKDELSEIRAKYGDSRKTQIIEGEDDLDIEDLIPNEKTVVMITNRGYIKRVPLEEYKSQKRGGIGVIGIETKGEDDINDILITQTHNYLLFFTNKGRIHWLKTYKIPEAGRYSSGKAIVNLLELSDNSEQVTSWVSVKEFNENEFLSMITKNGIVKRSSLMDYSNPRKGGIIGINLRENDNLVSVLKTTGKESILIATKNGLAIRFDELDAREIGRTGTGVIGIRMKDKDEVVSATICNKPAILTITQNGFGKRTPLEEYRIQGRGGHGVINIKTEGRNGYVIGAKSVDDNDQVIVISSKGQVIRTPVLNISQVGRNTMGVKIIRLKEGEKVANFAVIRSEVLNDELKEEIQKNPPIDDENN